jgi:hypothetical protein
VEVDRAITCVMLEENGDAVKCHQLLVEAGTLHPRFKPEDVFQRFQDLIRVGASLQ